MEKYLKDNNKPLTLNIKNLNYNLGYWTVIMLHQTRRSMQTDLEKESSALLMHHAHIMLVLLNHERSLNAIHHFPGTIIAKWVF